MKRSTGLIYVAATAVVTMVAMLVLAPVATNAWSTLMEHLGGKDDAAAAPVRVQYSQMVPDSQDAPYVVDPDASTADVDGVKQIAYDVCPQALDVGSCLDYTVSIATLGGEDGRVEVSWEKKDGVAQEDTPLQASGIEVDSSLVGADPQYVAYVAAHEWNHIEQINIAKTTGNIDAITKASHDYYVDRLGSALGKDRLGLEVLTDCMTVEGDNVQVGTTKTGPYYLRTYAGGRDAPDACGDWRSLLFTTRR